ncbi:hypothetical protein ACFQ0P_15685 [Microbacterium insulae]|uniref:Uncharacterized protein n=1 Tax=Microbacterium insulae TaxID=483014 RepID=A0ABW3ALH7_9MICO
MPTSDDELRFLEAMTRVAQAAEDPGNQRMYDLAIGGAEQFVSEYFDCSHGGNAYALWMGVSDEYDDPRGRYSEEACEAMGRKVANEWLAVDQSSSVAIDAFFARWQTPEAWSLGAEPQSPWEVSPTR